MLQAVPFLLVVGIALPWLAWSSHRRLATESDSVNLPSPRAIFGQTLVLQAVVCALAAWAAHGAGLSIGWRSRLSPLTIGLTLAATALALTASWIEGRRPLGPRDAVRRQLRKVSPIDPMYLTAATAAAVGEEYAYRGVLTSLAATALGAAPAALGSALLFGAAHLSQGRRGGLGSLLFALVFQAIVVVSGGLALAIVAHLAYDLGAAWLGHRLARSDAAITMEVRS